MPIRSRYDSLSDIPEPLREAYKRTGDGWTLDVYGVDIGRARQIERERDRLRTQLAEVTKKHDRLAVRDAVQPLIERAGIHPNHAEDARLYAERALRVRSDGKIETRDDPEQELLPGTAPGEWLAGMIQKRPGWTEGVPDAPGRDTGGGRSPASDGPNPWSPQSWSLTEQMKIAGKDMNRAERLAAAAGSSVGAASPPRR